MAELIFYAVAAVVCWGWVWFKCKQYQGSTVEWVANKDY